MNNYLFTCTEGENEGEDFLVGAESPDEARRIASTYFNNPKYVARVSDYYAETSGLDEY